MEMKYLLWDRRPSIKLVWFNGKKTNPEGCTDYSY